jgi:hypothetical protein
VRKAGGVTAIIAGVFGILAALFTLVVGGVGSMFQADNARTVVMLGWGGLIFSCLAIILGAVCINARSRWPSVFLVLCAICGIVLGGMAVGVFMVLALLGGLLGLFSADPAGDGSTGSTALQSDGGLPNADEIIARYLQQSAQDRSTSAPDAPDARAPTLPQFGKRRAQRQ